ncbi:hypothetical protein DL95DRAFT_5668 [Leptodontidium sp. 2 PMI_412]|nr:hypothetical protein DL95DRAFT_5668 [Leptodontidium sp. 2 PMI_412]
MMRGSFPFECVSSNCPVQVQGTRDEHGRAADKRSARRHARHGCIRYKRLLAFLLLVMISSGSTFYFLSGCAPFSRDVI